MKYEIFRFILAAEDDRPTFPSSGERLHFGTDSEATPEYHNYHSHRAAVDLLAALNLTLAGESELGSSYLHFTYDDA